MRTNDTDKPLRFKIYSKIKNRKHTFRNRTKVERYNFCTVAEICTPIQMQIWKKQTDLASLRQVILSPGITNLVNGYSGIGKFKQYIRYIQKWQRKMTTKATTTDSQRKRKDSWVGTKKLDYNVPHLSGIYKSDLARHMTKLQCYNLTPPPQEEDIPYLPPGNVLDWIPCNQFSVKGRI